MHKYVVIMVIAYVHLTANVYIIECITALQIHQFTEYNCNLSWLHKDCFLPVFSCIFMLLCQPICIITVICLITCALLNSLSCVGFVLGMAMK